MNQGSQVNSIDTAAIRTFLSSKNWPPGLQTACIQSCEKLPVRFFIVDDSGSMATSDGHRVLSDGRITKLVPSTRWGELTDAMRFHAELADAAGVLTEFRLLNGAPPIIIGRRDGGENMRIFQGLLSGSPGGGTPLCRHINEVIAQIRVMEPHLRANGQRAVVVIATDGESSDGNIAAAMKPLETLPVWVVIRLCTDDDAVVSYWNNIDGQLELEMDVLDDLVGEAKEVYEHNSWLTYGEPLHRLREWGVHMREMDLIDEGILSSEHIRAMCAMLLLGSNAQEIPHPDLNWENFERMINDANANTLPVWDPISQKPRHWIKTSELKKKFVKSSCMIM